MADCEAARFQITKETAIHNIVKREALRNAWHHISWVTRGNQTGLITRLLVPDPTDPNVAMPNKCKKWIAKMIPMKF